MASQLTHEEITELLGAYAIDAVDPDEAETIDTHLAECPRCRAEVEEHREAATLLSFSSATAPDGVWSRIAAGLDEAPPFELAQSIAIGRRRQRPRLVGAALATAAALVIAVLGAQVVRQDRRIDQLSALAGERGIAQAAAAAALAPDARTVRLESVDGQQVVDAVVLADGRGYLVDAQLPPLGDDETYQLWGIDGTKTISLGLLGGDPHITGFAGAGSLTALAITAEHAGGAVAPSRAPIVQGSLA